jgi:hypothetical protein
MNLLVIVWAASQFLLVKGENLSAEELLKDETNQQVRRVFTRDRCYDF